VQADNFFSSNELLNSRRELNNRQRDRFSTEWSIKGLSAWYSHFYF